MTTSWQRGSRAPPPASAPLCTVATVEGGDEDMDALVQRKLYLVTPDPAQIGPYRIVRRLGAGGMAEVFLGIAFGASGFEKKIAIKRIRPDLVGDAEVERALIEEARLGATLSHRNLVEVHELAIADGAYYVRLDYVDGADLATMMSRERPAIAIALAIAEEIAVALAYVHDARDDAGRPLGLVHRDVSPSNVLLSRYGEVKLADFGIAKATMLRDRTRANVRKGKYAYMSPEQVLRAPLGPESDQFGLGVMLAELLTGDRPYDGDSPLATMERIREASPPLLAGVDEELASIVRRCLARDPSARFSRMEDVRSAIAAARHARPEGTASGVDLARYVTRATSSDSTGRADTDRVG